MTAEIRLPKSQETIERWQHLVLFLVMFLLRVLFAYHFRVDTDEPQHLHVVWGWANGFLQYRDVFDNHGPIFHLLCVPLFRLLGERPDILIPMRLAMLPLFAICLWCVYRLGLTLFSKRVGIWAAVFTGFYPEFFFTTTEFRTDDLWTALWLLVLVLALGSSLDRKRSFLMGLMLGTMFGVTVKTGLMVGALVLAGLVLWMSQQIMGKAVAWRHSAACSLAGFLGFVITPATLILFFAIHGSLKEFLYCNITHNLVPHAQNWAHFGTHFLWLPTSFAVLAVGAHICLRRCGSASANSHRIFLALTTGFYIAALKGLFPTLTRQDDLPYIPLLCLFASALLFYISDRAVLSRCLALLPFGILQKFSRPFPVLIALAEILTICTLAPFWKDDTKNHIAMVADVLRLTRQGEFVMDATGETIFRPRSYYYALEAFTKVRIERGTIKDDIIPCLITTRTEVVRPNDLTSSSKAFVSHNYLPVGNNLRVLGKMLPPSTGADESTLGFDVVIPAL